MKKEERDNLDELFRSKLEHFEMDTMPGDWEAIADRLPGKASVSFRRTLRYWAAAAVISLLVVTGGIYVMNEKDANLPVASELKKQEVGVELRAVDDSYAVAEDPESTAIPVENMKKKMNVAVVRSSFNPLYSGMLNRATGSIPEAAINTVEETIPMETENKAVVASAPVTRSSESVEASTSVVEPNRTLLANATSVSVAEKKHPKKPRRWGLGMGGGGLSVGANNTVPQYMMKSAVLTGDKLAAMNSPFFNAELPKTDVHHHVPISFGLSASYYLNNRFSLQMGVNYSYLSSDWTTNGEYHGEVKQKLHFIGIPVSLAYKIAEWNRFQFYAAAGVMAEVNVAGRQQSKFFLDDVEISRATEHIRMKEWLWSVNARAGVSYPLIRFVSAFAEVGAGYYFDNGSIIETIHSEKPFNVSFQLGFRFGF